MAGNGYLMVFLLIGLAAAQDVHLSDITYTNPADATGVVFNVGTPTTITFTVTLQSAGGGVAVTGITAYFSNDAGDVTSDAVTATGTTTAVAGATSIVGAVITMTMDAMNCAVYTQGRFHLQMASADDDTTNDDTTFIADFGTYTIGAKGACVNDVGITDIIMTNPTDPANVLYVVGMKQTHTITVTLGQYNGGIAVTGLVAFFSNDDKTVMSDLVTITGMTTAAANVMTIAGGVVAMTMDAAKCNSYTMRCIRLMTASDPDSSNDDGCAPFGTTMGTIGQKDCTPSNSGFLVKFNTVLLIGSLLCALNFNRK